MFCKLKTIVVFLRIISDIIGLRNFGRNINIYININININMPVDEIVFIKIAV